MHPHYNQSFFAGVVQPDGTIRLLAAPPNEAEYLEMLFDNEDFVDACKAARVAQLKKPKAPEHLLMSVQKYLADAISAFSRRRVPRARTLTPHPHTPSLAAGMILGGNKTDDREPADWPESVPYKLGASRYTWAHVVAVAAWARQRAAAHGSLITLNPRLAVALREARPKIEHAAKSAATRRGGGVQ